MARINEANAERRIHEAALRIYTTRGRANLTISELAHEAGLARGTIYHYVRTEESLFEAVANRVTGEMRRRVQKSLSAVDDSPAARLAFGIRLYIRRAHDDPQWGQFIHSFGFRTTLLEDLWKTDPMRNLIDGLQAGWYRTSPERLNAIVSFIAGAIAGAMHLVSAGHETWRNAGTYAVEFVLQALGVPAATASHLASLELPPLLPDD